MSIHDGPGLRTAVFLKGCNMRCKWCHNPETWSRKGQLQYVRSKCIGCGTCAAVCPNGVLTVSETGLHIEFDKCKVCGTCAASCPANAISIVGREVTPEGLWDEIKKDIPFFRNSGGGVTVSGGEPLLQKEFVKEFLTICRENGVNTAVETNMSEDWETIAEVNPLVDIWMCDLKMADTENHKHWTGIGNEQIIGNILKLAATGRKMTVRTPVIPGVNDTEMEIDAICRLLAPYSENVAYELLGFHTLGFNKFENLGIENELEDIEGLAINKLEELKQITERYGRYSGKQTQGPEGQKTGTD